ncbi:hypothetical protein AQPE_4394 [Aquipluma nitroreducens]|uniref:DUF4832 domain-containing protein n=2 Tax=Aquipluma nitroreducens TaxID=2010828 RepID=A0A5K7SF75_9BACT|nr:hypothetical protein AQPE_4394 [Aquipluma nitroreducens]
MKTIFFYLLCGLLGQTFLMAQENNVIMKVKPKEINDVLTNPGIGFTTFQRFNGDDLNEGIRWTEGLPIVYQNFDGDLTNKNYPQTTIAYFRVNWRFLEPECQQYNWPMIDKALKTAAERGQTLMLRISPYEAEAEKDVPGWYREMVGPEKQQGIAKWRVDPEDPRYIKYFGGMIKALGQRYDGHPDLESVDVSFIGYWGEGEGSHLLSDPSRLALINAYLDNFKKTTLTFQPLNGDAPDPGVLVNGTNIAAYWPDGRNNGTGTQMRNLGWRLDCHGDLRRSEWNHMTDVYPEDIIKSGMSEAWRKAPVTLEICGTFLSWLQKQKYSEETVEYIFEQGLKWHVSSFNAKSSAVPKEWRPLVDNWLNKMGYRFVLRRFTYPSVVTVQGQLRITSWWENKGVAPIYKDYKFALRIKNTEKTVILSTSANILNWFPGDIVHDENLYIPHDMPVGTYELEIAIVSPVSYEPKVKLAIDGVNEDGWYPMGKIEIKENKQ